MMVVVVPFCTVYGWLSDIVGASAALPHQLGYVVPALTVLGVALSIALRRKGYTPASVRAFAEMVGVAKRDNVIDLGKLEYCVR
jgi:4-amino-4-deoxy-L-arabinose transferase-like glycosyltransferase